MSNAWGILQPRGSTACTEMPLAAVRGEAGAVFDVAAAAVTSSGRFFAVAMPAGDASEVYLLVDPAGRVRPGAYVAWREALLPGQALGRVPLREYSPKPAIESEEQPLFSFETVDSFAPGAAGYLSFDLVYTGTRDTPRGEVTTYLYREYARDRADKVVFERPLTFPVSSPVVAVGDLRLEVEPVGYSEIRFRVIQDGRRDGAAGAAR